MNNWIAKLKSKKLFLWDFDGCFADTERLHFLAYQESFKPFKHTINESEYYETFSHLGLGAKKEIENYKIEATPEAIIQAKPAHYWNLIKDGQAKIFPEMKEIFALQKKLGRVAIASNSPKHELDEILRFEPLHTQLDLVLGYSPGLQKKPAPDLFLKALELLNMKPEDAVVFEDSDRGLAAAQAAGCEAIWVKTPQNQSFTSNKPHIARITHNELLKALQG